MALRTPLVASASARRRRALAAVLALLTLVVVGCNAVASLGDYAVGTTTAKPDGGTSGGGDDTATEGGVVNAADASLAEDCGSASASSLFTASCTNSTCVPFSDSMHIQSGLLADGGLPPLPDAGTTTTAPTDAAVSDGGTTYPACSSLPNPVYMMGSNALLPIVQQLGTWANDEKITLIYTQLSSCKGVTAVVQNTDELKAGATVSNYWDTGSVVHTCAIDDASKFADVGLSSVFLETCLPTTTGFSGVADFQGPIVTSVWFVPHASTETSISAEAAYLFYSGAGKVTPWDDPNFVFLRGATGGTQVMMAAAIGVPSVQWVGTTTGSSDLERSSVIASTDPAHTIGLGEIDYAEDSVGSVNLHELAYRHYGQSCAYYPNSTVTSHDKRNVRDGHYVGWGPVHLIARVNAQGIPVNTAAGQIINYFIGNTAVPGHDFLSLVIAGHLVPQCAMRVRRTVEVGPPQPFDPSPSCACFFDSLTSMTSCEACKTSADCPTSAPLCNLGYCEPH